MKLGPKAWCLLSLAAAEPGRRLGYVMTNSNIKTAVLDWYDDPTAAEATYGHISTWETGAVTDMSYLFCAFSGWSSHGCNTAAASFNEDIGAWDTSGVTSMFKMFYDASSFNQDIGGWAVHSVTSMRSMFYEASAFNQDLSWCVDDDVDLEYAFHDTRCESTSCGVKQNAAGTCAPTPAPVPANNVMTDDIIRTAVRLWLSDATAAEATYGHISTWETSGVTDMSWLFSGARLFNEDIGAWDTSGVTRMLEMFYGASSFNQNIGGWSVHNVKTMEFMFEDASSFNRQLSDWHIDKVTNMRWMFAGAGAFDQDLGWCGQNELDLRNAFSGTKCKPTSCGVPHKDVIGMCEPWARPCLIGTGNQCYITSPTLIIIIVLIFLAGFGACVCRRKKKDETYVAAACRLLCCRSKTDLSDVSTRPDSPAESPPEEATAPKETEATAVAPEAEESPQETAVDEPPPPPAKSWFGRAEPESEEAERPPPPAKGWSFWRAEPDPEPEEAEQPPPLSPFSALRAERERELKTLASP